MEFFWELSLPSHLNVFLFQGFEGVSFTNSPADSIYDWRKGHEDASSNAPGSILVSCWLDFVCLPEFGEADFPYWPRANIWSPHLQYVPHWALGLHDSSWYVVSCFVRLSCPFSVALKIDFFRSLTTPFPKTERDFT